jgi:quercetin dioxygenase-like cupin family protein
VPLGRENWVDSLADRGTQPAYRYGRCPGRQTFFAGVLTSPGQLCPLIAPRMLRALLGKLSQKTEVAHFVEHATPKAILIWEEAMPTLVGFGTFAALPEEQISEKISRRVLSGDQGMIVWWSIGAGVHVEPHSHANEQIVWMLEGKVEFRLGNEQRVCGRGDVVVVPGGLEHEAWFRENTG